MNDKKGLFITFEGIDGCGKTTQMNLLASYLKEKNYDIIETLEPGGCEIGKKLRQILLHEEGFVANNCELFLYLADRAQHVEQIIKKNLQEGKIVLCDRFVDSTLAYQGYGRNGDLENLIYLNKIATLGLKPDITFLFDIDIETSQKRIGNVKDRLEKESLDFHNKVKQGYLTLANQDKQRIKVMDATKTIEEIFEEVRKITDERL